MSNQPLSREKMEEAVEAVRRLGSKSAAALELGIPRGTLSTRLQAAERAGCGVSNDREKVTRPFDVPDLPSEVLTAEEIISKRLKEFDRKRTARDSRVLVPVTVKIAGPVGIALMGDPHVDDAGTDIAMLRRHLDVIKATEGLLVGNVGDFSNNWIGRLARLYAEQGTSAAEAWVLVEWLIGYVDWLFLIAGNHDCWSGAGDPIQWMAKSARQTYEAHGMRLALKLPIGREIRINARHDFTGHSQWNTTHGVAKAAQMGWRDHILVAGHKHTSGYQVVRDPSSGLLSHCVRVGSYKTFDRYAEEKGLPNQTFMVSPTVVIRPQFADDDNRLVTTFFDPETAAEFLTWLRSRKSERAA